MNMERDNNDLKWMDDINVHPDLYDWAVKTYPDFVGKPEFIRVIACLKVGYSIAIGSMLELISRMNTTYYKIGELAKDPRGYDKEGGER